MIYYNYERFPTDHYGLTPMEVLEGQIPNKFKFRVDIKNAQEERVKANQKFNQCPIVCL